MRDDEVIVLAVQPDRVAAVPVDEPDHFRIDPTDEHHFHQLDRFVVCHPEAVDEAWRLAQAPHESVDLGPASMDDDGMDARRVKPDDVASERGAQIRTLHRGAAVLDRDRVTAPPAERVGSVEDAGARREGGNGGSLVRNVVFRHRGQGGHRVFLHRRGAPSWHAGVCSCLCPIGRPHGIKEALESVLIASTTNQGTPGRPVAAMLVARSTSRSRQIEPWIRQEAVNATPSVNGVRKRVEEVARSGTPAEQECSIDEANERRLR